MIMGLSKPQLHTPPPKDNAAFEYTVKVDSLGVTSLK